MRKILLCEPTSSAQLSAAAEDEGFDKVIVSAAGRRLSRGPPDLCIQIGSNPSIRSQNKKLITNVMSFLLAEDEGFEPPQTESESGVLPLHKSSIANIGYYTGNLKKVKD